MHYYSTPVGWGNPPPNPVYITGNPPITITRECVKCHNLFKIFLFQERFPPICARCLPPPTPQQREFVVIRHNRAAISPTNPKFIPSGSSLSPAVYQNYDPPAALNNVYDPKTGARFGELKNILSPQRQVQSAQPTKDDELKNPPIKVGQSLERAAISTTPTNKMSLESLLN